MARASKEKVKLPARHVDAVAAQVNALHEEFLGAARHTLNLGIRIGGLLAVKKEGIGHGNWLPWCERNLRFSERSAQNYLKLWAHRAELKSANVADLTAAYKQLSAPREERTINLPAMPVRQIRHGLAQGLRALARWIDS